MTALSPFLAYSRAFAAVFMDQYGVLHDGRRPYPGAIETLHELRSRGTHVVVLSNSGRPGAVNVERMARIGFSRDCYDHLLTSGDVAKDLIRSGELAVKAGSQTRCLILATDGDEALAADLGLAIAEDARDAELLVIAGVREDGSSLEDWVERIAPAAARRVPCVCTNPDRIRLTAAGPSFGAGRIAERYAELGGAVTWIGKPHPAIYRAAARLVGDPAPRDILCVGDSVEHDIVGAHRFGAAAALVRTGILSSLSETELAAECARHGVLPDLIVDNLAA